jgi:16S rRNA (uracil1498-N3)-methyltransferase
MACDGRNRSDFSMVGIREWGETFYAPASARKDNLIVLEGDEAHHLVRVLRKRTGDRVGVMDGEGNYYICDVENLEGAVSLRIVHHLPNRGEPQKPLVLLQVVLKEPAMDDVVDKATQMGVSSILWIPSIHMVGNLTQTKLERHWRIARAAAKQCGRSRIPKIEQVHGFEEAVERFRTWRIAYVAHPLDSPSHFVPTHYTQESEMIDGGVLLVGPEGGLTAEEAAFAQQHHFAPLSLGNRRLRSGTAATVGLAILLRELGEF